MIPIVSSVVVALVLIVADHAVAGTPSERLQVFFDEANAIIQRTDSEQAMEQSREAVRVLVNDLFAFHDAAAVALGSQWGARTPREQAEFVRLFADLLERGYVAAVASNARVTDRLSITFVRETVRGDSATVETTLLTRRGDELPVDYVMVRHDGRWVVRDVVFDGVSLVENYRAQFHRVMQGSSYAGLVAQMRERTGVSPPVTAEARSMQPQPPRPETPRAPSPPLPATAARAVGVVPVASPEPVAVAPVTSAARDARQAPSASVTAHDSTPTPPPANPGSSPVPVASRPPGGRPSLQPSRYWIQLGAFRTADAARRLAQRVRADVAAASTPAARVSTLASAALSRVRVGPFTERTRAVAALKALEARGHRGFIIAELE
jgi:phospholipid transport system substrate-binding protein